MYCHPHQAGYEVKKLESDENASVSESKQEDEVDTVKTSQDASATRESRHTTKETVVNTFQERHFHAWAARQTISYMEVISVEDQLVQAFCEQVPAPAPSCRAPLAPRNRRIRRRLARRPAASRRPARARSGPRESRLGVGSWTPRA
jgi:hypothetical protein